MGSLVHYLLIAVLVAGAGLCVAASGCSASASGNSSCRLVSGLFTRPQLPMGYNLVAQLPRAASNITVTELKPSRNYLALRRIDGGFALNGNWAINWSGDFEAAGAPFSYTRDDEHHAESITSPGPLLEPLDLMVIYQQPNPGIKYQYLLPIERAELAAKEAVIAPPLIRHPSPTPNHIPEDNKPLNNAVDTRPTNPVFPYGNTLSAADVHAYGDEAIKTRPKRKRKFNWKITGFTECSRSCGGGIQTAVLACVREHNQLTVTDRRCATAEKPTPQVVRCNVKPCVAEWVGGEWSECSVTCGEGVQTREILCRQEITTTLIMTVAEGACLTPPSPLLHRIRTCQQPPCAAAAEAATNADSPAAADWQSGLWTECSATCGLGVRTRTVSCPTGECLPADRPASQSICDMGPCQTQTNLALGDASPQGMWYYTDWTHQCSEGCGTGVQMRKLHCSAGDPKLCPVDSKPESQRACSSDKSCGYQWFTGPWSQCGVSCGWGRQSRSVVCVAHSQGQTSLVPEEYCPPDERPASEQPCQAEPCGPEWYMADWSQCSRSCDTGVQRRDVRCVNEHHELTSGCREQTKPPTRRSCNTHKCSSPSPTGQGQDDTVTTKSPSLENQRPGDQPLNSPQEYPECMDQYHNCQLVVQARLCKYKYYRTSCCQACHNKL